MLFALMFAATISKAQKNVYLTISHKLGASNFAFNQTAQNNLMQNFRITRVDYYISSIKIIHDGGVETAVPSHYILAKGSSTVIDLLGNFNVTNVEGVKFYIGVEAPTNNSDITLQPSGHPLSFQSPSMHWGWSSGYRFLALEGVTGFGFTTLFEMHGLGNANYFQQTVMTTGVNSGSDVYINLDADYSQALENINVTSGPIDHGVNATDLTALENFRDYVFGPGAGTPTSINNAEENINLDIYPNPSTKTLFINFDQQNNNVNKMVMTDVTGKVVFETPLSNKNEIDLSHTAKGMYILKFYNRDTLLTHRKIIKE
jgi:hypothetical protein